MNSKLIIPVVALVSAHAFCDCSGNSGRQPLPDMSHLPDYVAQVSISVYDNDSLAFASMVQYPLPRPYPLRDIADSTEMVAYYPVMVDDSLRSMAHDGWEQYGWRGWALADGEIWVDTEGIYDIPYMSAAERKSYDDLVKREMATLPADMRRGYIPVGCYKAVDSQAVYRIDHQPDSDTYRLAAYDKGARRDKAPDRILYGKRVLEGSAANVRYEFADGSAEAVLIPYPMSLDEAPSLYFSDGKASSDIEIAPVYWLDLLSRK